jgi:hypothetical protein
MSLKKKIMATSLLSLATFSISSTSVFADTVYDIIADSLSVRTGPGTSYTIIATVYNGTDLVGVPNFKMIEADGFEYDKYYYPKSSLRKYSSSAVGYVAYQKDDYSERYITWANFARGTSDPTNVYDDSSLTHVIKQYPKGKSYQRNCHRRDIIDPGSPERK